MSAAELEKAVQQLPPEGLKEFSAWFERYIADRWDEKIEQDILTGKFAHLAAKADADFEAGRCSPR